MLSAFQTLSKRFSSEEPKKKAEEEKVYNPLDIKIGGIIRLDTIDFSELMFRVYAISAYNIEEAGGNQPMVDYYLSARPADSDDINLRLRLLPDSRRVFGVPYRSAVLRLHDEGANDAGLISAANGQEFVITTDDLVETFVRRDSHKTPFKAKVEILADKNGDGEVSANEVEKFDVLFWDFERPIQIESAHTTEFLFIEQNQKTGWIQLLRGTEIYPGRISMF